MDIIPYYPLFEHNTLRVKSTARWWVSYNSLEDLDRLLCDEYFKTLPFISLGEGSNTLFVGDYDGVVLKSKIKGIEVLADPGEEKNGEEKVKVRVGSGEVWDDFVEWCLAHHYFGLENLSGIPGSVGASAVQNIGAYGTEVGQYIVSVTVFDLKTGEILDISRKDCCFGYRTSIFKDPCFSSKVITHVTFSLETKNCPNLTYKALADFFSSPSCVPGFVPSAESVRKAVLHIRDSKLPDPKKIPNAGSFFKNPVVSHGVWKELSLSYPHIPSYLQKTSEDVKLSAAWLIQECGFKGKREGNVGCYLHQPLVIVNYGTEDGEEIASFASKIVEAVQNKFSILLEPEVRYIVAESKRHGRSTRK